MIKVALLEQPGDVYAGVIEIEEAAFDDRIHLRAEAFGGSCDLPAGKYCWNRAQGSFVAMQPEHDQRVQDFVRITELALRLAARHLNDHDATGADAAELIALGRRHFPHQTRAALQP